ncbi:MAG: uroporphyrinogen decarboxylase family protein [Candidatus Humimicrobiaceae bacterium]
MNSRERINTALNHKTPDKLPVDFGGTPTSGIHAGIVYKLRQYFGLDKPGTPVKIIEPYQMLGEVKDDLKQVMGIDVKEISGPGTMFGFKKEYWKPFELWDGTPLLVPGKFNTEKNPDGTIYQYAEGDRGYNPSAVMPKKGYFFDSIIRQKHFAETELDPKDNTEEFNILSNFDLSFIGSITEAEYRNTEFALIGNVVSSSFGDIALVPGSMLKDPKGIRDITEWYISTHIRKDYVKKVFETQCEIAIENYSRIYNLIADKLSVVFVSGTDFGAQDRLFASTDSYREIYKPFHLKVNNWIHENTGWRCFIHTCGSIKELIPDLIEAGFDIVNPVQISAAGMDPEKLKKEYGRYLTFWGGGVDTQKTLAVGSPAEVKDQVKRMIDIFNKDGGFVFSTVHNIQANVPLENVIAMIEVIKESRK